MPMRALSTLLALSVTSLLACDSGDDSSDSSDETGGDGSGCFIRATLEQTDGMVAYDVAAIVDQSDPARHMIETDFLSEDTIHVLRLSWPAALAVGSHELLGQDIAFTVVTELGGGELLGETWPGGSVTFTQLGEGLAGSLSVTPRPAGSDGVYVVDVRDAEFGCE